MIRHGQTTANLQGVVQGHDDSPLTPKGQLSSQAKAAKLARFPISAVYCSDLPRARATLAIIMQSLPGLPPAQFTRALREIDFGIHTGAAKADLAPIIARHKADTSLKYPGGESGGDLWERVRNFLDQLLAAHPDGHALLVTHYGVMETIAKRRAGFAESQPFIFGEEDLIALKFTGASQASMSVL